MENNWIKAEDRLPEYNKKVLVFHIPISPTMEGYEISIDKRINHKGTSLFGRLLEQIILNKGFTKNVTHWMPLPENPKNT